MAPLHLLTATMKSGRGKEIITTEGVGEGGREVEEEGGVASMEAAGAVATATTMVMAAGAGTMKSRMNTMTSLKNMARPQAVVSRLIISSTCSRSFCMPDFSWLVFCCWFHRAWQGKKGSSSLARAWWPWAATWQPRRLLLAVKRDMPKCVCSEAGTDVRASVIISVCYPCSSMELLDRNGP